MADTDAPTSDAEASALQTADTAAQPPSSDEHSDTTLPNTGPPPVDSQPGDTSLANGVDESQPSEPMDTTQPAVQPPTIAPTIPQKKDLTLAQLLSPLSQTTPLIPDAVTDYYLTLSGLPPASTPRPLARLLALATQKFIADIAADAYQYSRIRSTNTTSNNPLGGLGGVAGAGLGEKEKGVRAGFGGAGGQAGGRTVLTMEDLGMAVGEYGVNVRRGEFYR